MKIHNEYKLAAGGVLLAFVFMVLMVKIPSPEPRPVPPTPLGTINEIKDSKIYLALFEPCAKSAQSAMMIERCQIAAEKGSNVSVSWDGTTWKEVFK